MTDKTIKEKAKVSAEQVAEAIEPATPFKFAKQQLLKSKKYVGCRDALSVLLKEDKAYTHGEVQRILDEFYKGGSK